METFESGRTLNVELPLLCVPLCNGCVVVDVCTCPCMCGYVSVFLCCGSCVFLLICYRCADGTTFWGSPDGYMYAIESNGDLVVRAVVISSAIASAVPMS